MLKNEIIRAFLLGGGYGTAKFFAVFSNSTPGHAKRVLDWHVWKGFATCDNGTYRRS